jgi:putative ABC transport system permease protein
VRVLHSGRAALHALGAHKLRSGLTMLGLVVGVAAVVIVIAIGAGAKAEVVAQVESLGSNLIIVLSSSANSGGVRLGQGTRSTITEGDAEAIAREIDSVQVAASSWRGNVQAVRGELNWSTLVQGASADYLEARDWDVTSGRPLTPEDVAQTAKVVILGATVAHKLFGDADPVDHTIRLGRTPFTVVGVLARKGPSPWGNDQDDAVVIPLSTAKKKVVGISRAHPGAVASISVKIRPDESLTQASAQIRALLRQRHGLSPEQGDDFTLGSVAEIREARTQASNVMASLLVAIASVALLVGGVGVTNIMLVTVKERRLEIGIRMAVGARRLDILTQFLLESVILSVLGGLFGVAVGIGATWATSHLTAWPLIVETEALTIAVGFAASIGLVFGVFPATRAAQLAPAEALRTE